MKSAPWFPILRALANGDWLSLESLQFQLSLSNLVISQRLAYLRNLGVPIDASELGYRIAGGAYIPDITWLTKSFGEIVDFMPEVGSTNSYLLDHGADNRVLMTLHQTSGRGRYGRTWRDAPGKTLMFSMGLFTTHVASSNSLLPISVGAHLCAYFNNLAIPAKLKWPNDIWIADRKLAGFLLEIRGNPEKQPYIVIGLGLNLDLPNQSPLDFASIAPYLVWTDQHTLKLLEKLRFACLTEHETMSDHVQKLYDRTNLLDGRQVTVLGKSKSFSGVASGIDKYGRLRVLTDRGEAFFSAGEVSVRPTSEASD